MRKLRYIITASLLMFAFAASAQAQTPVLPNPGITPDSPFYFLDKWGEAFGRFFAFGAEAKAAKQAEHAEERLAEAQQMADEGKDEEVQGAVDAYGDLISGAAANLAAAARSGEDTSAALTDLVTKATSIHLTVLAEVYEKVPEQAKPAIQRAMTQSTQGQEAALNALSGQQHEDAMERVEDARQEVEQRLNELRQQGIPIPDMPTGGADDTTSGRPTSGPGAGNAPAEQVQQNQGPPAGAGAPQAPSRPGQL